MTRPAMSCIDEFAYLYQPIYLEAWQQGVASVPKTLHEDFQPFLQ